MTTKRKRLPRIDVVWERPWWLMKRSCCIGWEYGTQAHAIREARALAGEIGGATVRVHRKDGRIRAEYTYPRSADPRRSKG